MRTTTLVSAVKSDSEAEQQLLGRADRVSVCVPVLDEAETIGTIIAALARMRDRELVDEVVVVDGGSVDGSAAIAAAAGADVHAQSDLLSHFGAVLGKGDGLWRAQAILSGDIVCFVDGDLRGFTESYVLRLVSALVMDPSLAISKGAFRRPFHAGVGMADDEGGRVTRMVARPLLRSVYPELLAFDQPLSGQIALRRSVLAELPVLTGYAFDVGLLVDIYLRVGLPGIAQVDLGTVWNRHRSLMELETMAYEVSLGVLHRSVIDGRRIVDTRIPPTVVERPPFRSVVAPGSRATPAAR